MKPRPPVRQLWRSARYRETSLFTRLGLRPWNRRSALTVYMTYRQTG